MPALLSLGCIGCLLMGAEPAAGQGLVVRISSDKEEYVLNEPMKVVVTIVNNAGHTVRIPHVAFLSRLYMNFMYYEVISPNGSVDRLKHARILQYGIWGVKYPGAPFGPGDSVQVFLYPNNSNKRVALDGTSEFVGAQRTFPVPGRYRFRVIYQVWPSLEELYQGTWPSNQLEIHVRPPNAEEREIVETLWHCMPDGEAGIDWGARDLGDLESVLTRYPNAELLNHARLALARGLIAEAERGNDVGQTERAMSLLSDLRAELPAFRSEEIDLFLAKAHIARGDGERGGDVLFAAMRNRPILWTNADFVEAVTVIGIRDFSVSNQWFRRESERGAKPMSKSQFFANFSRE